MCGIFARINFFSSPCTLEKIYKQLLKLTHRGSDGMGIVLSSKSSLFPYRWDYIPSEVVASDAEIAARKDVMMGVGHVRYRTNGKLQEDHCQPFLTSCKRLALVHNGHIQEAKCEPDSRWLLSFFENLPEMLSVDRLFEAVQELFTTVTHGSYSCVVIVAGLGLLVFRDRRGIRPLVCHQSMDRVIVASENVVFPEPPTDVQPGQCLFFGVDGTVESRMMVSCHPEPTPCLFEYIYFADKDSVLDGIWVYEARQVMGRLLARRILQQPWEPEIDLVVPVPKTSCVCAKEISRVLRKTYVEALTVSKPVSHKHRSFILPREEIRMRLIQDKFTLDKEMCRGKKILLVDDSIVRGTTMKALIRRFRMIGVNKVYVASCAPPVFSPNVFGIDVSTEEELVANQGSTVATLIGADDVIYQDLDELCHALPLLGSHFRHFEKSMFVASKKEKKPQDEKKGLSVCDSSA